MAFVVVATMLILLVPGAGRSETAAQQTLAEYQDSISRSCQSDQDCAVKDVHNCCGYYPECVNKATVTNPGLVDSLCKIEGMAGICGFPSISGCHCIDNVCKDYYDPAQGETSPVKN